jgi:hypothetical protein
MNTAARAKLNAYKYFSVNCVLSCVIQVETLPLGEDISHEMTESTDALELGCKYANPATDKLFILCASSKTACSCPAVKVTKQWHARLNQRNGNGNLGIYVKAYQHNNEGYVATASRSAPKSIDTSNEC